MDPEIALRKRSSLKTKISIPDHLVEEWNKPKKLHWDVEESEPRKQSDCKIKFKEADTHYTEIVNESILIIFRTLEMTSIYNRCKR